MVTEPQATEATLEEPQAEGAPAQGADAAAEAAPEAEAPPAPAAARVPRTGQFNAVGRRKTATARVILRPGSGRWRINGRSFEAYFPRPLLRQSAARPLALTETEGEFDLLVTVRGGGLRGQAEAVRLGVARALVKADEELRRVLRGEALLTRDAREVERKKPGRPKARKRFQFSKR